MTSARAFAERAPLDAYYTPIALADACCKWLAGRMDPGMTILEPHVGRGAFASAAMAFLRPERMYIHDLDPIAPGYYLPGTIGLAVQGSRSFLDLDHACTLAPGRHVDLILGNPPFSEAEAHRDHALRWADRCAYLLRLDVLAREWAHVGLESVLPLRQRPKFGIGPEFEAWLRAMGRKWGSDSAEYGLFVWSTDARWSRLLLQRPVPTIHPPMSWR